MRENLRIEQALFGYAEGHHLVASSVELGAQVRQFLADVTDSSGPEKTEGFEAAYTGLPVPNTNYYALFCTWPAPEMPRPGCVWSHVLLIDLADLARIPDLSVLRQNFLRPAAPPGLLDFGRPLTQGITSGDFASPTPETRQRAEVILGALYGGPENGIVILDESSRPCEELVFAIWSQQWPRLRRSFAFSTGSLGDRRSIGVPFDLQVAPLSSQRLWERGSFRTTILQPAFRADPSPAPWVSAALDDLLAGPSGAMRRFLFAYGSEVELQRQSFAKLAESYLALLRIDDDDPSQGLLQLAEAFPHPTEALTLKRDRLAQLTKKDSPNGLGAALAALYFIFQAKEAQAFSSVPVDFGPPVSLLWHHKRSEIMGLLASLPKNERADALRKALASALSPQDLPGLWREQPKALEGLLAFNPGLAGHSPAWAMPEAGQQALWNGVRAATDDSRTWARTCIAMLGAHSSIAESETVKLAGPSLTEGLVAWLQTEHFRLPSYAWREALRPRLAAALEGEPVPPPLLAFAGWVLPGPQARSVSGARSDVQELARHGLGKLPGALVLHTNFWLAALGLGTGKQEGLALLSASFFRVYDAVAASQYPAESWDLIAPVLPELLLGLDWDRCKRLRLAMRRWLNRNPAFGDALQKVAPTHVHADLIRSLR